MLPREYFVDKLVLCIVDIYQILTVIYPKSDKLIIFKWRLTGIKSLQNLFFVTFSFTLEDCVKYRVVGCFSMKFWKIVDIRKNVGFEIVIIDIIVRKLS